MILLCPPEKSTHFHYPLDPKKIRAEGSMHKDAAYRGVTGKTFTDTENKTEKSTHFPTGVAIRQPSNKTEKFTHFPTGIAIRQPSNKKNKTNKSHPPSDWDCHTGNPVMTDIDMFQFFEQGMRRGISYIANRYGKASNKYMKLYDNNLPSKYIMYLDANNLFGWAMSQYLPTDGFK